MHSHRPIIGVTLGDPKGIGPEIVAKAMADPRVQALCELRVFGDERLLRERPIGLSDADAGLWSAQWVAAGVRAALGGSIAALVTAPINKERWQLGGIAFPGHTEYLAHLSGQTVTRVGPFFISPRWRVGLATGHLPLKHVAQVLRGERIVEAAQLIHEFCRTRLGIAKPRLACLGLNPHAGEHGHLGFEEKEIIEPAISLLHDRRIFIDGPFPADTFFRETGPDYDAVLAMYHDQGLIPVKSRYFAETVQVTMGLPFLRASVDHGTAEDIAWKGRADHGNLVAAIRMAVRLCRGAKESP
ncbi:MAG: 4-hydroxythreonine-4-phosphate dehydrogenase PdxA [Deltaproteobacteria bacterium]|nr:4-hydroxythreonine-4-phosphate dehydrogenase PdxA [Deltaproteobacteria bacterium]